MQGFALTFLQAKFFFPELTISKKKIKNPFILGNVRNNDNILPFAMLSARIFFTKNFEKTTRLESKLFSLEKL